MSTRWPAHVKRTPLTGAEGTVAPCCAAFCSSSPSSSPPGSWPASSSSSGRPRSRRPPRTPTPSSCSRAASGGCRRRSRSSGGESRRCSRSRPCSGRSTGRRRERLCAAHRYAGARVVCFTAVPFSTRGEAETVARLARARGWHSVVVVTSTFHITRAHMLFRRCFHGRLCDRRQPARPGGGCRRSGRPRRGSCSCSSPLRARLLALQPPVAPLYVPPKSASGVLARIFRSSQRRAVLDVPDVELDALGPRQRRAAVDLRPAGDARLHVEPRAAARSCTARPGSAASAAGR